MCEGHQLRINFMFILMQKYNNLIDLYGDLPFANKKLKNNEKFDCLIDYEYCIAFDNQNDIIKFFGTQFTDSILCYTIPIYWGGSNEVLKNYFPEKSFETIDIRSPDSLIKIINIITESNYVDRIEELKIARLNILNKYNVWPTIKTEIQNNIIN